MCCGISTCSGWPKRSGRRRASARATRGVRSSAICRSSRATDSPDVWARAERVPARRLGRCAARCVQPTGQDWGLPTYAGTSSRDRATRGCDSAAAGWPRSTTACASITSSGSIARTAGRRRAIRSSSPADEPDQIAQGEAVCRRSRESGPVAHRRGPRRRAGLPAAVARAAGDSRLQGDALGARLARAGRAVRRIRRRTRRASAAHDRHARHRAAAGLVDGAGRRPIATALLALPVLARARAVDPEQPWTPALRDALIELALASGSDEVFLPIAGRLRVAAIASTRQARSPTHNWTWCLPWPVDDVRRPEDDRGAARALRADGDARDGLTRSRVVGGQWRRSTDAVSESHVFDNP